MGAMGMSAFRESDSTDLLGVRPRAGVSKSDLAREALRRFLAVSEFQCLRAKLVRRAQIQGIHTDEDVVRVLIGREVRP